MHSIVMTFRGAGIKVEVANFCAAMDTLIDQDEIQYMYVDWNWNTNHHVMPYGPIMT